MTSPERFMQRALELAALGRASTHPNPRVGCVIVSDGDIVGEGWHVRAGEPHAEVHALRQAGAGARGATAYVTLEPCAHHGRTPPCVDALIAAGVGRVVAAMQDLDPRTAGGGFERLRAAGIDVEIGLLEAQAQDLNRGFVARLTRGRPWLSLKLAMSLDGRTAMADGESRWITGPAAREDVHRLRAEAGAVLTTAATVLADDPQLTVRLPGDWRQPDRIVIDSRAQVPRAARVWAEGARRFHVVAAPASADHAETGAVPTDPETIAIAAGSDGHILLPSALSALAARGINEALVECGPVFAGVLLQSGLVDELVIYVAPRLLGHQARPFSLLPGLDHLADGLRLQFVSTTMIGDDLRIIATPETAGGC